MMDAFRYYSWILVLDNSGVVHLRHEYSGIVELDKEGSILAELHRGQPVA